MFITLKATSAGRSAPIMEQVASKNASNGEDANHPLSRLSRKPACVSCQKRKLRCTGRLPDCDRCRARAIPCVASVSHQGKRGSSLRSQSSNVGSVVGAAGHDGISADQGDAQRKMDNLFQNSLIDFSLPDGLQEDIPNMDDDGLFLGNDNFMDTLDDDPVAPGQIQSTAFTTAPYTPATSTTATQSIDHQSSETGSSVAGPTISTGLGAGPSGNSSSPTCSCTQDVLNVVQQLDDDDFKLTTLAFDQVVQLQKWIMSQCCKPLDCAHCRSQSTALVVILIICDRLTEMFECIHKRLRKAAFRVREYEHNHGTSQNSPPSTTITPDSTSRAADGNGAAQLFCTFSGGTAGNANCNPDLFSAEFQNLYSDEEQVHMIQALTRLQIRNFRGLLMRVDGASQGSGAVARRLKIEALAARVTKAAGSIEAVW